MPVFAKPKTKAYSTVIFFFLVIALFGWYAIKPTIQTILFLQREIVDKTDLNKKMDEKINALIIAQNTMDAVQNKLSLLEVAIPSNPDAVDVAKQIQNLTTANQASISAAQISTVPILIDKSLNKKPGETYMEFPVNVTFTGEYANLKTVLTTVTGLQRALSISSLTMNATKDSVSTKSASTAIQAIIKVTAFYRN